MFYIWFSYLKKHSGLGPGDTVGVILDEKTLEYINDDSNPYFSYIAKDVPFQIEVSTMLSSPTSLSAGCAERYNNYHFTQFTKHSINVYLDIDCLSIRPFHQLFASADLSEGKEYLFAMPEIDDGMTDSNYGGYFIEGCPLAKKMPGFSSGWFAWTSANGEIQEFFDNVSKGVLEYAKEPLYTVDQPFYNYEIYLRMAGKRASELKICIMDSKIVTINPLVEDPRLASSFFANFCGEPGVEDCHFYKLLSFMCVDFSTPRGPAPPLGPVAEEHQQEQQEKETQKPNQMTAGEELPPPVPLRGQQEQQEEEEHGLPPSA